MNRFWRGAAAVAAASWTVGAVAAAAPLPANVEKLESAGGFDQYRLRSNGMTILLAPNHAAPVFTFMVVYHVGSRNEAPGNTGSAHLLEHMIFNKSTENFGRAKGHKTFQEVLYEAGADYGSTNMTTWYDRMNGYSTLPADKLELAMKIEADRLGRALILDSERQPEMSVVRNEYEIGENDPSVALSKAVTGAAIVAHPYHWDTIGYRSDIEGVSTEKLREHYKGFFWPDNAEAILVGDFEPAAALVLFDREFGAFPRSSTPIPQVVTQEPPQEGERRVTVKRPGSVGIVQLAYMRPNALHPDFLPLEVLTNVLGTGVNSRLYQALVEAQLATDVAVYNFTLRDPYPILFEAMVAAGTGHQKVEDALKTALRQVSEQGVTDVELQRAQKQIEVAVIKSRDGTFPLASAMGEAVASANWRWFVGYVDGIKAVTAEDVKRVAASYLVPDHATVGWFVPVEATDKAAAPARAEPAKAEPAPAPTAPVATAFPPPSRTPSPATAPRVTDFGKRTLRRVLPNGVVLDVLENHAVPTIALRAVVLAGLSTAPRAPALPQLTAMMLERGTKEKSKQEIAALLDGAGATLSFVTTEFEVTARGAALSRDAELLLSTFADQLRNPAFRGDEFAKAQAEMRNDVLRDSEDTSWRALERLTQLAFPSGHPYRAAGRDAMVASLEKASVDDLRLFHEERYVGASLMVAVVGDVDAAKTMALLARLLGPLPKGARPALDTPRTAAGASPSSENVTLRGKANMNLVLGHASGLRRGDKDYEAALIGNAALGQSSLSSRIGRRVRDTEGLSYSLGSRFYMSDLLDGVFFVSVNVAPQNLQRALASTREEVEKLAKEGVTEEEVEVQKSFFAGNYQVGLGSNGGVAQALVTAEKFGYGPRYLDEFPGRIRAVTRDQVNAALKVHLDPAKLHTIVAGDVE